MSRSIDYEKLEKLISLVERTGLTELTVEEEGFSVTIKAEDGHISACVPVVEPPAVTEASEAEVYAESGSKIASLEAAVSEEHLYRIQSPMIGVFYRRPSPDSPPYVRVGDVVEAGQTVGLIEAMKVFSEVPTEHGGRVVAVLVENAKLVQRGDVLAAIDTSVTE